MNVLVLGANGAVGQIVIVELLKSNHEVTALVRNAGAIQLQHPRLTVIQGTPTNMGDLEAALAGQDAVLSTLGARTNKKTTLRADVAGNVVSGMRKRQVRRLVWLDAAGVGSSKTFVKRSSFLFGRIVMPLLLNHMYNDAAVADSLIEKSGCEWIIVRPMSFTNKAKAEKLTVLTDMSLTVRLGLRIARADVAAFMVEQLTKDDYVGKMPIIHA
ncbi:NAD-dependent epimerase/dehydratase family protein [Acidobacteria bacterium AB60]|nr:NAD-dependent epimerase/dehydratase family protein [Acidobacteria bacterium AB60]